MRNYIASHGKTDLGKLVGIGRNDRGDFANLARRKQQRRAGQNGDGSKQAQHALANFDRIAGQNSMAAPKSLPLAFGAFRIQASEGCAWPTFTTKGYTRRWAYHGQELSNRVGE